jgi:predicted enzyme related to lactoylglutathione lyase
MPDAFESLRVPAEPVHPDPTFAAQLKQRVRAALGLEDQSESRREVRPMGVIPYLAVADARRALDWYVEVLGAARHGEPIIMPDERVGHAELELNGGLLYLADEFPEIDVRAPEAGASAGVSLTVTVNDVDAITARSVRAGATLERPPSDSEHGRMASIRDPFGHRWLLQGAVPTHQRARHGDVAYASLWVPDAERAAEFFGDVLGWRYEPQVEARARQVEGLSLRHGIFGGQAQSTLFCCYLVDDVDEAVERVRAGGGQAQPPKEEPYGRLAECTDPLGMQFALLQSPTGGLPRPGGSRPGDVAYLTLELPDADRAREFYGSVLGWRFTPGQVEHGWQIEDVAPMTGLWGGRAGHPRIAPMYRVDNIHAAVERVRARGGRASEVTSESYGLSAECEDDQGTRFWLGQL